jgi:hypothetical protein
MKWLGVLLARAAGCCQKTKWRILEPKWPPVSHCLSYVLQIVMDAVAIIWTFFGWYMCGLENLITFFKIMCLTFCFIDFAPWWIVNTLLNIEFQNQYFEKSY